MLVIYNWIIWLMCYFLAKKGVTSRIYPQSKSMISNKYHQFFFLVTLYSMFTFFGGDIKNDKEMVEGGYQAAAYSEFFNVEYIYVLFAKYAFSYLLLWKIYVYGLCIFITMWTLKLMKRKDSLTLLFYTLMFLPSMGATRGVLAYSVFILATYFIKEGCIKERIVGYLMLFSTYFLHSSMTIPIILFFISGVKLSRIIVLSFVISIPVISGLINGVIMPFLEESPVFMASQMGFKYQQYIYNEDVELQTSLPLRIYNNATYIFLALCLFFSLTAGWKIKLSNYVRSIVNVCFFLAYIGAVIALCEFQNNDVIARRFFTMSSFFFFIIIPELINLRHLSWMKSKLLIDFGFFRVNWFFAMMLWNEIS